MSVINSKSFRERIDIPISLTNGNTTTFILISEHGERILNIDQNEIDDYNEAQIQIFEASTYEYVLSNDFRLSTDQDIISESKIDSSRGRLHPNNYVGSLTLTIYDKHEKKCGTIQIEVRSIKTDYRTDYRNMLEDITEWSTELILQHSSPVTQNLTVDYKKDARSLYQRFAFIKSILESKEFEQAIHRIIKLPSTEWEEVNEKKDIRSVRRASKSTIQQITRPGNRIKIPSGHSLYGKIDSVPHRIETSGIRETIDTPENRFIKYALELFLKLCSDFKFAARDYRRLSIEAKQLENQLEIYLNHDLFRDISQPDFLPLNSPILQRKEGYREILRIWLMFDLASNLTWKGGPDVYEGGKKDVATLYEYWVFFKLLQLVEEIFKVDTKPAEKLLELSEHNLNLKLIRGKHFPLKGVCDKFSRKLNVQLSYNRTFKGQQKYPKSGSWTNRMNPDYTLTIWPYGISEQKAEEQELIVHVHFDAKYKIENLGSLFESISSDQESEPSYPEEKSFKNDDVLKMHAYRDAIRRTGGAYILYPGDTACRERGFHEVIPGLGAFNIQPSENRDGINELRNFLKDMLHHFLNRTSQRESLSFHHYHILKQKPKDPLEVPLPQSYNYDRSKLLDQTRVLVAYYKNRKHYKWIVDQLIYNTRTGLKRGAIEIGSDKAGAEYLLLHTKGEVKTDKLFKIRTAPSIYTQQDLVELNYPNPTQPHYLTFQLSNVDERYFQDQQWDISKLPEFRSGRQSAVPFTTTLANLFRSKV